MNKKIKTLLSEDVREHLVEQHSLIQNSIDFWEERMDSVVDNMNELDSSQNLYSEEQLEGAFNKLTTEMQFILKKLELEEREVSLLEDKTNKLLAQKLFKSFKKVDGDKNKD
jgi:hypothetical protein